MSELKLSERLRFESHEAISLDICIDSKTFNQWADEVATLEQRVEQQEKDWLLMMQEVSGFDHETDWHNAGEDVLLEQFDPWATLRVLRKRVEGLEEKLLSVLEVAVARGEKLGYEDAAYRKDLKEA